MLTLSSVLLLEIKDIVLENILAKMMTDVFLSTYTLTEGNGLEGVYSMGGILGSSSDAGKNIFIG